MASPGVYAKGVAKREEILRAALRVFERDGNAGTTMRAVAKEAGLSLAGLTHYFPSRDLLLTEVLFTVDREFEALYYERPDTGPGEFLARAMERNQADPVRVWLYLTMLAATRDPEHPAAPFFRDRFERFRTVVAQHVRDQQARGEVPAHVDPDFAARSLLAAADGIQNVWLHDRTIDMGAHIRTTWRLLIG
ncbi:TetR/AcrR family transcriptional regulator [Actinomadura sp. 9N407]|uniref:TetR/AcrR family transcriptional regulator n=1 Tax=Actinomadura sp. 9N407 TaxID=3375154 RepID=UPI0037892BBF